jgi:aldose 1-epimerase
MGAGEPIERGIGMQIKLHTRVAGVAALATLLGAAMTIDAAKGIDKKPFGRTTDGADVDLYTLTNAKGVEVAITNFGGIVVSLKVPDRQGTLGDVTLGFARLESYLQNGPFFGALIGRYGNRIAKGKFTLNGKTHTLPVNNGPNSLHGGIKGFHKVVWQARPLDTTAGPALELKYLSKDGEEGYPGNLRVAVTYTLTDAGELKIDYLATTDQDTVVNLTNHAYFNLDGEGKGDVLGHELELAASRFTPVDASLIPLGELRPVVGTPFDFVKPHAIGERINATDEQIERGGGYDHNFVLDGPAGTLHQAAKVFSPKTGRLMEVLTTEPGIQFYSGNFLDGTLTGKAGAVYQKRSGFCLETQHYPDSPNQPNFPTTVLKPGQEYRTTTVYRFSVAGSIDGSK